LFAVLAIGLWSAALLGYLPGWQPVGGSLAWHRHELPFGFAVAIIAGFLLTAVQNWTGRPGLSGWPLAALFALWLLARLAWLVGVPLPVLLVVQLPFLPLLALLLGRQLWQVRQWRNYPLVVVLLLMAGCEWLLLYGLWRGDDELQRRGALAGLWLIAALVSIIGGRVIPFFTQRGLNQLAPASPRPRLDLLVLVLSLSLALLFASGLALQPTLWMLPLLLALAALPASAAQPASRLSVEGTEFVLYRLDGRVLRSAELVGAELDLGGGRQLRIDAVRPDPGDASGAILLHSFSQREGNGAWMQACEADGQGQREGFPVPGRWVEGRYRPDRDHFALTCSAGAQAKCVRWGYKPWASAPDGTPMAGMYEACVHMARADYCGDGTATTRDGTAIDIYDRHGVQQPAGSGEFRF